MYGELAKIILTRTGAINEADGHGETVLHKAMRYECSIDIDWFMQNGAHVNTQNNEGETPLSIMCGWNKEFCLSQRKGVKEFIKAYNPDVNLPDKRGKTPLHIAAYKGHLRFVKALVEHDANTALRDQNGYTAVDYAIIGLAATQMNERASYTKQDREYLRVIKYLIKHTQTPSHGETVRHQTPLQLALAKKNELPSYNRGIMDEVIEFLRGDKAAEVEVPSVQSSDYLKKYLLILLGVAVTVVAVKKIYDWYKTKRKVKPTRPSSIVPLTSPHLQNVRVSA